MTNKQRLALFDLDNTLLSHDSDFLWGQFLAQNNYVDAKHYEQKNQFFYDEYKKGTLNIHEFLEFSLKPLAEIPIEQLKQLHLEFMQQEIIPYIGDKAKQLVKQHRDAGDYLLMITATNLFVTKPIAQYLTMDDIIATIPEYIDGQYTGKVSGIPSFQQGKVDRLNSWLELHPDIQLNNSIFYSDSYNDLPLLQVVDNPVAVNPDEHLNEYANTHGWKVLSF